MIKQSLLIGDIPALLWGEKSEKVMIAVHGNMSSKSDIPIVILAEEAVALGYQVLSFDLPQHGDRKNEATPCKVQNCVLELYNIGKFAAQYAKEIHLFACSMGAYFSLLAYKDFSVQQSLFLSPVVDMYRILRDMMKWLQISEEKLRAEQEIPTPMGQTLYWDYYCYVKTNPIVNWESPTTILYGSEDKLCNFDEISSFVNRFHCSLEVMENGEHYFYTPKQLGVFRQWLKKYLVN
ncbi:alpha/beta hydrolase [Anaerosinus massiliensis]|uniref:alpha/beta hydrolase n=1 Tax=Massilibacillus massiliensis TaxID=1806837 RepID=UPI000A5B8F6D|nr:alpha/beta hydrolase [Massilibacillus massiliensis]